MASHDSNVIINIILDAAPPALFGFTPLLVSEEVFSERLRSYTSAKEVAADSTISADAAATLTAMFAQTKRPGLVKLGKKLASETYVEALTAIETDDDNWYGVAIDSRTPADIVAVSNFIEARRKLFVAQTKVADWLDGSTTIPTGFTTIAANERTAVVFHDEDTAAADAAWLANRLVFNPDTYSAPWDAAIQGVPPYTDGITTGQRVGALSKNVNLVLPYGPAITFVDAGVNIAGRPIYEIVTGDWFALRLEMKVAQAKINASARGEKIPLGMRGISILRPIVEGQFSEGISAGHFIADQTEVKFLPVTAADIAAQRIRATGRAQVAVSARIFEFDFVFQRDAVFIED